MNKIDFVITWVDGTDEDWLKDKNRYDENKNNEDASISRYRNWDLLKYWFRSVEENAPWVNKIYFITYGHVPNFLKLDHPKIEIVKHSDFIPNKYLPVFNSCAIEVNFDKINSLSEHFVYFNDDMFLNKKLLPTDFFKNNLPCDSLILTPINASDDLSSIINYNCMRVINRHFDFKDIKKSNLFSPIYGKYLYKNITLSIYPFNVGYRFHHCPTSFLKSTFKTVNEKEQNLINKTSSHRFRNESDVSQWLYEFWQLASNNFSKRKASFSKYYDLKNMLEDATSDIFKAKHGVICLNDTNDIKNFSNAKQMLTFAFEKRYPNKSSFEK